MPRATAAGPLTRYRNLIREMATEARDQGASADEINTALADFGLPPLNIADAPGRQARYQVITKVTVHAEDMDETEARDEVNRYINNNNAANGITSNDDDLVGHQVVPDTLEWSDDGQTWTPDAEYWAAHAAARNPAELHPVTNLTELKRRVRKHLLRIASRHGWSCGTFEQAWHRLDLGPIPTRRIETRELAVTGTTQVTRRVYDGMDAADVDYLFTNVGDDFLRITNAVVVGDTT